MNYDPVNECVRPFVPPAVPLLGVEGFMDVSHGALWSLTKHVSQCTLRPQNHLSLHPANNCMCQNNKNV